jgi:hypothetical protein
MTLMRNVLARRLASNGSWSYGAVRWADEIESSGITLVDAGDEE